MFHKEAGKVPFKEFVVMLLNNSEVLMGSESRRYAQNLQLIEILNGRRNLTAHLHEPKVAVESKTEIEKKTHISSTLCVVAEQTMPYNKSL